MNPFATATELLADLRAGKITSSELTDLYIRRIERYDAQLNAVVVRDFEAARTGGAGRRLPPRAQTARLAAGLPITLKESINVAGLPTTCGVPEWKDFVSQHDAPAWARLRAAGAVLIGKTNVPPMLADWQSANPGLRAHEQPVGSRPHAGRQQRRQRGRAGGGAARARSRLGHRRLDPRAGRVLRRLRPPPERDAAAEERPVPDAADAERRRS